MSTAMRGRLIWIQTWLFPVLSPLFVVASPLLVAIAGYWLSLQQNLGSRLMVSLFDFGTPIPFAWISTLGLAVFSVEGYFNRYLYGANKILETKLRTENYRHGETKRSYYDNLGTTLKHVLAPQITGFDERCRVTVYRADSRDKMYLKKIFRYSKNKNFQDGGRFKIPISEGVVGVCWSNHGESEFCIRDGVDADEQMDRFHEAHGGDCPDSDLSMPTMHFFCKAFDHHDTGQRIAVVVCESTSCGVLNVVAIKHVLSENVLDISRLLKVLGLLDMEFNPDQEGAI